MLAMFRCNVDEVQPRRRRVALRPEVPRLVFPKFSSIRSFPSC